MKNRTYERGDFVIYNPKLPYYDEDSVAVVVRQEGSCIIIHDYEVDEDQIGNVEEIETDLDHIYDCDIYTGRRKRYRGVE